jgi:hypothetical protein
MQHAPINNTIVEKGGVHHSWFAQHESCHVIDVINVCNGLRSVDMSYYL